MPSPAAGPRAPLAAPPEGFFHLISPWEGLKGIRGRGSLSPGGRFWGTCSLWGRVDFLAIRQHFQFSGHSPAFREFPTFPDLFDFCFYDFQFVHAVS